MEGLRSDEAGNFILQDGIFKRICEIAKSREKKADAVYDFDKILFENDFIKCL